MKEKPLNNILGANIGMPSLGEAAAVFTTENVLNAYEREAQALLRQYGYPITLEELWVNRDKVLPDIANGKGTAPVYNLFWMLWYLNKVRQSIKENNADQAVCFMASVVHFTVYVKIKPIAPFFDMGQSFSGVQKMKRAHRKSWSGLSKEQLRERNIKMLEHFKKAQLSPSSFATRHAAKYNLQPRQIRNIIKEMGGN